MRMVPGLLPDVDERKKYSETFDKAAEKADKFYEYANKDKESYTKKRDKFINQGLKEGTSKKQANYFMDNNIRISKRQAKRYKNLANKYRNVDYDSISRKDYKEAKKFLKNAFHTNANLAWVSDTYNYEDHD